MFNKKRIKNLLVLSLVISFALITSLTGVVGAQEETDSHEGIKVGITLMTTNNPYFKVMVDRVRKIVEEDLNGELIVSDGQFEVSKQTSDVQDMIVQGIDLLLYNAVDSDASDAAVSAAKEAGIPVLALDVDAAGPRDMHIASDNYKAGKLCGEYTAERLDGEGKIGIVTGTPITSIRLRKKGFMDVISQYEDIEVVSELNGETNRTRSMQVAENMLQANRDLDAIFGVNDPTALGILAATESAGRDDELFITGVDGSPDGVDAVQEGTAFMATAAQNPAQIAEYGLEYGLRLLEGEEVEEGLEMSEEEAENSDKIPESLIVDVKLITEDNAENFSWSNWDAE